MNQRQWDTTIAPQLRLIESAAQQAKTRAAWVAEAVQSLPARPEFITKAHEALKQADTDLAAAHLTVKIALQQYEAAPVMHLGAAE